MQSIKPEIPSLIKNEYGNYLMQKVCEFSNIQVRGLILESISGSLCELVSEDHGTFVFQTLL